MKNEIVLEGHTDSQPYSSAGSYTNWELSADRANAARRIMERSGLRNKQITEIRGYADTSLRVKSKPLDPRNRRVSVIVQHADASRTCPRSCGGGAADAPAGDLSGSTQSRIRRAGGAGQSLTLRGHGLRRGSERESLVRPLSAATEAAPVTPEVTSEPGTTGVRRPVGEIVDWSVIDQLRAFSTDDMDLVRELVASFEVNVTQHLPELEAGRAARRRGDDPLSRAPPARRLGTSARDGWSFCANGSRRWAAPASRLARWNWSTTSGPSSRGSRAAFGTDDAGN